MNMNFIMRKSSVCVLSLAFLALVGCNSHGGSATTPDDLSTMDVNTNLPFQGQPATAGQIAQMNRQCRGNDNGHRGYHRDAQLRQNDSEIKEIRISNGSGLTTTTVKNTYLGDDSGSSRIATKVLSILNSESGEYLSSPVEYTSICKSEDQANERSCNTDNDEVQIAKLMKSHLAEAATIRRGHDTKYTNCMMGTNENTTTLYEVGSYALRDRQSVPALREVQRTVGIIMCNGRYAGHGAMTTDQVYSTQMTSVGQLVGCKGSEVYSGYTFRLDNGTVLSSTNTATVSGAVR
jgi:hypothetical protein